MQNIKVQSLGQVPMQVITEAWNKAFADYAAPLQMDEVALARFLGQNGVNFEASVGAFDGEALIGLWMNGVRMKEGRLTAYDSGTAVCPEYRSKGISKELADGSDRILKKLGVKRYILEVMANNEKAFNLYRKKGFEIVRKFKCYKTASPKFDIRELPAGMRLEETTVDALSRIEIPSMNAIPSWQNAMESCLVLKDKIAAVVLRRNEKAIGHGMVQMERGRIPQINVAHDIWGTDAAAHILKWLCGRVEKGKDIAAINVDEAAANTNELFLKHGFTMFIEQFEMAKDL